MRVSRRVSTSALLLLLACAGGQDGSRDANLALATVDVTVSPANLLLATGSAATFTATVTGTADTRVTWSVQEGALGGSVDAAGVYTPPSTPGTYHVAATSAADPSRAAVAVVTVVAATQAATIAITIAPSGAMIAAGTTQGFTCDVAGSNDRACAFSLLEGAAGGTIDPASGRYTAPSTPGTYHVVATSHADPGTTAEAVVVVTAPPSPGSQVVVAISPASVGLLAGAGQTFTCVVTGSSDAGCLFAVQEGAAGGTIDASSGRYTAPGTPGTFHVVATSHADPTRSATAAVTVAPAPPAVVIAISPSTVGLLTGIAQDFSCTVTGVSDTACSFAVQEGSAGGTVDATSGHYSAPGAPGTYHVVATSHADPTKRASATVTVTAPPPPPPAVGITISPVTIGLSTGAAQGFSCTVTGSSNTACSFSVQEGSAGGTIDTASGRYTAPATAGTYHVVAKSNADPTKSATATVTVSAPPPPVTVAISPSTVGLTTGATQTFACTVQGSSDTACTYAVQEGASGGSIGASSGAYTAPASAGTYHVVATSHADPTKTAMATVTVTAPPPPVSVAITPGSASVAGCQAVTFTATVSGTTNQTVTWSVVEGTAGGTITAKGAYTAPATAGTYHVVATSQADPTKSQSAAVVVSDKVLSVTVSPASVSVQVGQTVQFSATVTTTCGSFSSTTSGS